MSGPVHAIIISQGSELTRGEIQDSNARFLAAALTARGVTIVGIEVSPDEPGLIAAALGRAAGRAELVICTGGLGPTVDDRTAEAVGIAFGMPLEMREDALGQIVAHWERRGRRMPEASRKLALLPKGCAILANPIGTAPGFRVRTGGTDLYFLPGVPHDKVTLRTARHRTPSDSVCLPECRTSKARAEGEGAHCAERILTGICPSPQPAIAL